MASDSTPTKRSAIAKRVEEFASEPSTANALAKLIYYSAAMVVTPLVTYNVSMKRFVPCLFEKYGTEFLENPTTCSGLLAILSVQVVLAMYVISALRESSGGSSSSSQAKKRE